MLDESLKGDSHEKVEALTVPLDGMLAEDSVIRCMSWLMHKMKGSMRSVIVAKLLEPFMSIERAKKYYACHSVYPNHAQWYTPTC